VLECPICRSDPRDLDFSLVDVEKQLGVDDHKFKYQAHGCNDNKCEQLVNHNFVKWCSCCSSAYTNPNLLHLGPVNLPR
jgi:hypothetical protein